MRRRGVGVDGGVLQRGGAGVGIGHAVCEQVCFVCKGLFQKGPWGLHMLLERTPHTFRQYTCTYVLAALCNACHSWTRANSSSRMPAASAALCVYMSFVGKGGGRASLSDRHACRLPQHEIRHHIQQVVSVHLHGVVSSGELARLCAW